MTLDARSKARLEALGRTLPKKLPPPGPPAAEPLPSGNQSGGVRPEPGARHRLEKEEDPAELFRALMTASPDGSVPPHLLERLRDLETPRGVETSPAPGRDLAPGTKRSPRPNRGERRVGDEPDLYTTFAQLLSEDDPED